MSRLLSHHCGLYAISNGPRPDLLDVARAAIEGGATVLQYRDKTIDHERRLREACALNALCRQHSTPLIINDDLELAQRCGAAGVHLGEHDDDVLLARATLGADAIIGVSCYDSFSRAHDAAKVGADYLAFGAFFPSPTKPHARRATPDLLCEAKAFGLPLVAIGGITPDNGGALIEAGADFLAVVSALFDAANVRIAARRFSQLFESRSL